MKTFTIAMLIALGAAASGCASIVGGGNTQDITVNTNPPGASCVFYRQGVAIGTIAATPGTLNVKRRKHDITIKCEKPGFAQAEYFNKSGLSSMVAGNVAADLILTAGISSIVDSANGADNEYTGNVIIGLTAVSNPPPAPAPTPATLAPTN